MNWSTFLSYQLEMRKKKGLWRQRKVIQKISSRTLIFDKQEYINFSSNDYLGLSQNLEIIKSWQIGLSQYGTGSGSSGHIVGYSYAHSLLEKQLSSWLGYPRALLFISGYSANQSVIMSLMKRHDYIVVDKLIHASILEAALLSPAKLQRFSHNQVEGVKALLDLKKKGKTLVVTEGLFSMDGDTAPLSQLQEAARKARAWLLVDDAHGIGISGHEGKGSCNLSKVKPELLVISFSKAFGLSGAALLCDENTADYFLQYGRHLIYSTSMPPSQAVALVEALRQLRQADKLREKLRRNIDYFRQLGEDYNLPLLHSLSPIQPLIVGANKRCLHLSRFLRQRGYWVQPILPPTVAVGTARLRITLIANHEFEDIKQLMEALNEFFDNYASE